MQDQGPDLNRPIGRRGFLEAGAGALAVAAAMGEMPSAAAQAPPRRRDRRCCPGASWAEPAST